MSSPSIFSKITERFLGNMKPEDLSGGSAESVKDSCDSGDSEPLIPRGEIDDAYLASQPRHRRYRFIGKALILLSILIVFVGFAYLVARWTALSFLDLSASSKAVGMSSSEIEGKEHGQCIQWQDSAHSPETNSSGRDFLLKAPCGQSAAEARERGCRFGMLYFAWLPEQCYDEKIEEDFKNFKEWKFWLFQNRTGEITWDEAATGEYDRLYAEWEQHQRHCVDMFRRLHRVMASSSGLLSIDSHLSDWDHTEHCSRVLMERERSIHDLNSVRRLKYPDCGLLRW